MSYHLDLMCREHILIHCGTYAKNGPYLWSNNLKRVPINTTTMHSNQSSHLPQLQLRLNRVSTYRQHIRLSHSEEVSFMPEYGNQCIFMKVSGCNFASNAVAQLLEMPHVIRFIPSLCHQASPYMNMSDISDGGSSHTSF